MSGSGSGESGNVRQPGRKLVERSESNGGHRATKSRKLEYKVCSHECSHCNKELSRVY